jgi:transcriptional regulator with PAS, ATPase and Fis domain
MLGQMFGYAKGIHNMAYRDTPGLLAHCKVGTIFLDEVDRLDNEVQGRLLTLLDKPHAYYPLGYEGNDEKKQKCTASLVFATNKNISELLSSRILENDFYYRITNFFTIDLQPLSSNQEALEHSILIHWEEKKRQLNAMEYGNLEEKFPEAWKIYTDRSIVRFNGNHRDVQKLLQYCIFWLKEKKLCNKPETISAEEARALLLKVDHAHGMVKDETPFSELRFEVQVAKLAAVVADNPDMKRVRAAQLLGLDKNTNPVNRVIAEIKKLQEKPEGLTETLWKAVGEFVKERKEKG